MTKRALTLLPLLQTALAAVLLVSLPSFGVHAFCPNIASIQKSPVAHQRYRILSVGPSPAARNDKDTGDESSSLDADSHCTSRRSLLQTCTTAVASIALSTAASVTLAVESADAAPPIAIMEQELGYFPVRNKAGDMVYVGKRVQRESSDQAIALAAFLTKKNVRMYGAFWCPHCARQKELFGKQAWSLIDYQECAAQGYQGQPTVCLAAAVDGYPAWKMGKKELLSGERPLAELAEAVGFSGFRPEQEENLPPSLGSSACKQ